MGCACHHSLLDLTSCSEPASLFLHFSKVGSGLHNVEDTVTLTSSNTELPVSREEGVRTRAARDGGDKDGVVGHVEGGEPQDDHVHGGQTNTIDLKTVWAYWRACHHGDQGEQADVGNGGHLALALGAWDHHHTARAGQAGPVGGPGCYISIVSKVGAS